MRIWPILFVITAIVSWPSGPDVRGQAVDRGRQPDSRDAVWILSGQTVVNARLAAIRPEVHSVREVDGEREIRSAGISMHYFGPFQSPVNQIERIRRLRFRLPLRPTLNDGIPVGVGPEVTGLFVNGAPIYNPIGKSGNSSYLGQNIWHFDPLAMSDDGSRVATGWPRPSLTHPTALGILEGLIADSGRHSPLLGFAFDGFPIYGPWGYTNSDGTGGLRRMRSSYRQRLSLNRRNQLPDGTRLEPGQEGPAVSGQFPLGSFIEDFEYVAGTGDLDRFNGRWTVTPEYPEGTYAYFMTTDEAGRLAFPYLLAGHYRGRLDEEQSGRSFHDESAGDEVPVGTDKRWREISAVSPQSGFRLSLEVHGNQIQTGHPIRLRFRAFKSNGEPIRYLENVHERPLHLLVVAEDLEEFDHIHPELAPGDFYQITHRFRHGGRYRLYADFTPPGGRQQVVSFIIDVGIIDIGGTAHSANPALAKVATPLPLEPARPVNTMERIRGLEVTLTSNGPLRSAEESEFSVTIREGGRTPDGLEPFLGAWAHFVIIDPDHRSFIHAHPFEEVEARIPDRDRPLATAEHYHLPVVTGPAPPKIRTLVIFPRPGRYRMWVQFQLAGELVTQPFDLAVGNGTGILARMIDKLPDGAIRISVSSRGFTPAEVNVKSGEPIRLVFERETDPNCASEVVFPALGIRQKLPPGGRTTVELPAVQPGTLGFSCGMGMYKGLVVSSK